MCGHGMVLLSLINHIADKIKNGNLSLDDGAALLAKPCLCDIFNKNRAKELIIELIQ